MAIKEQETPYEKRTHRSVWPYGHQKWPKCPWDRKTYVVTISKTNRDRAIVTYLYLLLNVNGKSWAACHSFAVVVGIV